MLGNNLASIANNKRGLELGGPSDNGLIIYHYAKSMDNVIYSRDTIWANHNSDEYNYYENKKGKVIISDATDISNINDEEYDFAFSCHLLEHIANPLKAIKEWLRVIKKDGFIIIVVPEKSWCFDHKRNYSTFSILLSQFEKNVGEDDLTSFDDILLNHDLTKDLPAGTFEEFKTRSLNNFSNRCLHHYVYSDDLLIEICNYFKCLYIYHETQGINRWFIMRKI